MTDTDQTTNFIEQITSAYENNKHLSICGGQSKNFLFDIDQTIEIEKLSTTGHTGIVNYLPSELTITVRTGTPILEVQQVLSEKGQMLAFDPPVYNEKSTIGGVIATGLSGPRRPFTGSVRDFVLGTEVINGKGEHLKFGGEVMKNVAGYDVSRLMVGAMGQLGLITSVSLKVLPILESEQTIAIEMSEKSFFNTVQQWLQKSYPLSAAIYFNHQAYFRLSASSLFVQQTIDEIKLDYTTSILENDFWNQLNNQTHEFFNEKRNLLKVLLPMYSTDFHCENSDQMIDWGGGCRWLYTDESIETIRKQAEKFEGTAQIFRDNDQYSTEGKRVHPRSETITLLEKRIKKQFDPQQIFNPHYAN